LVIESKPPSGARIVVVTDDATLPIRYMRFEKA